MTWNGSTAPYHAPEEPRVAPKQPPQATGWGPAPQELPHAINHRA
jgi:hypothetical protein